MLSDESIRSLLTADGCCKTRKTQLCPNDRDCEESFGPIKEASKIMKNFRSRYWNVDGGAGQIFQRRKLLLQDIEAMKVVDKDKDQTLIQYKIAGIFVCKSFFFVSTLLILLLLFCEHDVFVCIVCDWN